MYNRDPVPEGFQPIRTAPTDGRRIMLGWHNIAGGWLQHSAEWRGDRHSYPGIGRPDRVTYWRPMTQADYDRISTRQMAFADATEALMLSNRPTEEILAELTSALKD
jgi:hypothetical protein